MGETSPSVNVETPPPDAGETAQAPTLRRPRRTRIDTRRSPLIRALADLWFGLLDARVWALLAWADVRHQHRRSKLGPLWITLSMGFLVGILGFLFAELFGRPAEIFVPHLCLGFIVWRMISAYIEQGCRTFTGSEGLIRQLAAPLSVHTYRLIYRVLILFAHHFVVFLAVALLFRIPPTPQWALALAGVALIALTGTWVSLLLGMLCARYRDVPTLVSSATYLLFFLTPVIWMPEFMARRAVFLAANPFHHFIETVRGPLLNKPFDPLHWQVAGGVAIVGWIITLIAFARFRSRVAYWL